MNASVHQSSSLLHFSDCIANASSDAHQILKGVDNGINRDSTVAALDVKNTSEVTASRAFADNGIGEEFWNADIVNWIGHVMLPHSNPPSLAAGQSTISDQNWTLDSRNYLHRNALNAAPFNSNRLRLSPRRPTRDGFRAGAFFIPSVHADNRVCHSNCLTNHNQANAAIISNTVHNHFKFKPLCNS